jgi:hypothetical protein
MSDGDGIVCSGADSFSLHHQPPAGETSSTPASQEELPENSPLEAIPGEKSEQNNVTKYAHHRDLLDRNNNK